MRMPWPSGGCACCPPAPAPCWATPGHPAVASPGHPAGPSLGHPPTMWVLSVWHPALRGATWGATHVRPLPMSLPTAAGWAPGSGPTPSPVPLPRRVFTGSTGPSTMWTLTST